MPEKVFVTGANGLLGHNLTRELISRGYQVTAFVPRNEPTRFLETHPLLNIRRGNLLSYKEVLEAMKGCDSVVHAGANTTISPAHDPLIFLVNVNGTRHVIDAALALHVRKMVNVASASMFGFGPMEHPGDESSPYNCAQFGMDYHLSKLMAYQEVQRAVRERGLNAVTVCPTYMLGAFDARPSSGAMLLALYQGKIPGYTGGGRNYIHVRDVAVGIVHALEYGSMGEAYILGNRNMDYKSAFALMAGVMHIEPPKIRFPDFAIKIFGALSSFIAWVRGTLPTISYKMSLVACADFYYSAKKAVRELNLPQTPIEIAVEDAMNWFSENGYVTNYHQRTPVHEPEFEYETLSDSR